MEKLDKFLGAIVVATMLLALGLLAGLSYKEVYCWNNPNEARCLIKIRGELK